jgi:hypothetical protein
MTVEISRLELRAESDGFVTADERMKKLADTAGRTEKATDSWAEATNRAHAKIDASARRLAEQTSARNKQETEEVRRSLATQEESIRDSYAKRKRIIEENTKGEDKNQLLARLEQQQKVQFSELSGGMKNATENADSLGASFGRLAAPLIAATASMAGLHKIVGEVVVYDKLVSRLEGVMGGLGEAREKFDELEIASDSTMQTENELVEAFLRMKQTGLDPSARALQAFSNIASGTGKSFDSLIEMTMSASLGAFRGLKDMGIKAVADGDTIKMTYRGVATTIKNSVEDIQQYLIKIGETDYAGAATRELETMGGAVKKLEDAWGDMFRDIGRSDVGDLIKSGIEVAADAVNGLSAGIMKVIGAFDLLPKKVKEMSSERKGSLNDWIRNAESFDTRSKGERDYERLQAMAADTQKFFEGTDQAKSDKLLSDHIERRKFLMEASVTQEGDFRSMLEDEDRRYAIESKGTAKQQKESKGYEPFIAKGRDQDLTKLNYLPFEGENGETRLKGSDFAANYEDRKRRAEAARSGLRTEIEELKQSEDIKRKEILNATEITETERGLLMERIRKQTADKIREVEAKDAEMTLSATSDMFSSLSEVTKNFGAEQSATYQALFALSKSFAVAELGVKMYTGMAEGLGLGFPAGLPQIMGAAAMGAKILAMITSTNFTGAHDAGGFIPGGKFGLVAERRPELLLGPTLVQGPARVVGGADTARMMGGGGSPTNVKVVVAPNTAAAEQYLMSSAGEKVLTNFVSKNRTMVRSLVK